jgi:hypothetical protein
VKILKLYERPFLFPSIRLSDAMRRHIKQAAVLCLIVIFGVGTFGIAAQAPAAPQQAPPPSAQHYDLETAEQLQRLVAPIALYPDSLVASILAASCYPSEISEAYNWLAPRRSLSPEDLAAEADKQSWDPSVKELLPFPPALQNLASNLSWTSELGDAYVNQQAEVMDAIQVMRRQAKKSGALKSNDQIHVTDKHGYITIEPARPDDKEVFIPAYDPWLAYGYPIDPWPGWVAVPGIWWDGPGLYYGIGFGIGPFIGFGWGWNRWGVDWYHRGVYFGGRPYYGYGPGFFNRYDYYRGYPGFARTMPRDPGYSRGFTAPRSAPGLRSGPFTGVDHGGTVRGYSARGQGSFNGGFHGGGFSGGGFHGGGGFGGGGFHGGGGGRR